MVFRALIIVNPYSLFPRAAQIAGDHLYRFNRKRRFVDGVIRHAAAKQPGGVPDEGTERRFLRAIVTPYIARDDESPTDGFNAFRQNNTLAPNAAGNDQRENLFLRLVQTGVLKQTDLPMTAYDREVAQDAHANQTMLLPFDEPAFNVDKAEKNHAGKI